MCGVAGLFGPGWNAEAMDAMLAAQRHRGPDATGTWVDPAGGARLGHNRLSILDLSDAGRQPMASACGRWLLSFNGEIYNYRELRAELGDYPFRSRTDTEVLLAAWSRWGDGALERLVGMFAFLLWDTHTRTLTAVRDRFGVKPLLYRAARDGRLALASEMPALEAAGCELVPDEASWATWLVHGEQPSGGRTFWSGVQRVPPGHLLTWRPGGGPTVRPWYDFRARVGERVDERSETHVMEEYRALLDEAVRYRFRSDVPVGVAVSGGVDSSALLSTVASLQGCGGPASDAIRAYTFVTGDPAYDELPWVQALLEAWPHPLRAVTLRPDAVPELAQDVWQHLREPYGGLATLAYAELFTAARADGVPVLLDGQGMDEQWAGYDYYRRAAQGDALASGATVQGTTSSPVRAAAVLPDFAGLATPRRHGEGWQDPVRALQARDLFEEKLPRALRYADAVSMRASVELREPFLDHRLVELAFAQPTERKVRDGEGKWLLRRLLQERLPATITHAPKRPLQTPQREWLRGPLAEWVDAEVECAIRYFGGDWLDAGAVRTAWTTYLERGDENSNFVWQWITLGLCGTPTLASAQRAGPWRIEEQT